MKIKTGNATSKSFFTKTILVIIMLCGYQLWAQEQTRTNIADFIEGGFVAGEKRIISLEGKTAGETILLFTECESVPTKLLFKLEYLIEQGADAQIEQQNIPEGWKYAITLDLYDGDGADKGTYNLSIDRLDEYTAVDAALHDELSSCYDGYYFTIDGPPTVVGEQIDLAYPNIALVVLRYTKPGAGFDIATPPELEDIDQTTDKKIALSWSHVDGISYEVEWVHIDVYDEDQLIGDDISLAFAKNGKHSRPVARISTDITNYSLPLAFPEGSLAARVRALGYDIDGKLLKTTWSSIKTYSIDQTKAKTDKNWQVVGTFAEGGKQKKVVSYFDGLGKSRQTLTNLSSINKTLVTESMYDYEGRPAIEVLPAPLQGDVTLDYQQELNAFSGHTAETADKVKQYYDNGVLARKSDKSSLSVEDQKKLNLPLAPINGAARYYHNDDSDPLIPKAEGYVYSYTAYRNDGNSNPIVQAGVGEKFSEGSKDTRYYFGSTSNEALQNIFPPGEVADAKFYRKNTTIDPNGQASVSYVDPQGRTVATALMGPNPLALDNLPSNDPQANVEVPLTNLNIVSQDKTRTTISQTITHTGGSALYKFNYSFADKAGIPADQQCDGCTYNITFRVTDPLGVDLINNEQTDVTPATYIAIEDEEATFDCDGEYRVLKTLTVNVPTYSVLKTRIEQTPILKAQVDQKVAEIEAANPDKAEDCDICLAGEDCVPGDTEKNLITISAAVNCDTKTTDCDREVCEQNKPSAIFDMEITFMAYQEAYDEFGATLDILSKDPYFNEGGAGNYADMEASLNSFSLEVQIPAFDSDDCLGTKAQTLSSSGNLLDVLDPGNMSLSTYECGLDKTLVPLGYNVLYPDLAPVPGHPQQTVEERKWIYYRSYYLQEKSKIQAAVPLGAGCTDVIVEQHNALYEDIPKNQEELNTYLDDHLEWTTIDENGDIVPDESVNYTWDDVTQTLFSGATCLAYENIEFGQAIEIASCLDGPCKVKEYKICTEYGIEFGNALQDPDNYDPNLNNFNIADPEAIVLKAEAACEDRVMKQNDEFIAAQEEEIYEEVAITELVKYKGAAGNLDETLTYTYPATNNSEYHYTLYFYDQAGNLYKTVPPKGVTTKTEDGTPPVYQQVTTYVYNAANQLHSQHTPDANSTSFYYDSKQQLRLSQNAKQACLVEDPANPITCIGPRYSYTKYDALGRIIEVGEIIDEAEAINITDELLREELLNNQSFPDEATYQLVDITKTYYDDPLTSSTDYSAYILQENLESRVAAVETYRTEIDRSATTIYSYDEHGNVKSLLQDIHGLSPKRIDYAYDLVSGNVNEVRYQPGQDDEFYHRYTYDDDNRITHVKTSRDGILWDTDAQYNYYDHGPLRSVRLGEDQVQKCDYHYTLQGWLKGINTPWFAINGDNPDAGEDNVPDAFAMKLGYFNGDYSPIGVDAAGMSTDYGLWTVADAGRSASLYNGNIAWMTSYLPSLDQTGQNPLTGMNASLYRYDQLNRIKSSRNLRKFNSDLTFSPDDAIGDYDTDFSYDANGNLLTLDRRDGDGLLMAHYSYTYDSEDKHNRLLGWNGDGTQSVHYDGAIPQNAPVYEHTTLQSELTISSDQTVAATAKIDLLPGFKASATEGTSFNAKIVDPTAPPVAGEEPIDTAPGTNYGYDPIGNLIADEEEGSEITWTVYGKVRTVEVGANRTTAYDYDGAGNRVYKRIDNAGNTVETHYLRDASGNIMATYKDGVLQEHSIYGSSRLGVIKGETGLLKRQLRRKQYELTNHLGNVMAVVSDRLLRKDGVNAADMVSTSDYFPFGLSMPGRSLSLGSYRYGFNGKEKDQSGEFGSSTHYDYGFRIYDPSIAKFLSVDPLTASYPWYTPYQFAGNKPIWAMDLDGLEELKMNKVPIKINTQLSIPKSLTVEERLLRDYAFDRGELDGNVSGLNPINWVKDVVELISYDVHRHIEGEQWTQTEDQYGNISLWGPGTMQRDKTAYEQGFSQGYGMSSATAQMFLTEAGLSMLSSSAKFTGFAKDYARGYAKEVFSSISNRKMPRAVSAVVDTKTGKVFFGRSGELLNDTNINPALKDAMNFGSREAWEVSNCSECAAVNKALNAGSDVGDLEMHTLKLNKKTKTATKFERCENCKSSSKGVNVTSE